MNSEPRNIEIFNKITAHILIKLYESFPIPLNLHLDDIYDKVGKDCIDGDEGYDILKGYIPSTMAFLSKEKFIEYAPVNLMDPKSAKFYSVVLTLQGLTLLNSIPDSISISNDSQTTFIDLIKESIKNESAKTIAEVIKSLFTHTLGNIAS